MQTHDAIIFDLDGTLWDTCIVCADAWNRAIDISEFSFRRILPSDLRKVTGKPHEECIRETFTGLSATQIRTLIAITNEEENKAIAQSGGSIYPGVGDTLKILKERHQLFIVSNCQAGYIETFLEFSGYESLFVDFESWGNTGFPKAENIKSIISRNNLTNPVYVGDTDGDRMASRACGIPFIFASYGFGRCEDYDMKISTIENLLNFSKNLNKTSFNSTKNIR